MIEPLKAAHSCRLVFAGRSRTTMAFLAELEAKYPQRVIVHAGDENVVALDRDSILRGPANSVAAEVYCCGPEFAVAADENLLDLLEAHGVPILGSCRKGICGTCELRVLEGTPEHLDSVLDDAEKDSLRVMYPCVSRSQTPALVLNI